MKPFLLLIKPTGSDCNIDCKYCFYKSRAPEVGRGKQRMSDETLETMVRDYMALDLPEYGFMWQGGEPTLMGLDFYKKFIDLQKKYNIHNNRISNSIQTNGILLDEKWCNFLRKNNFLVGISIDGPKELHDYYRVDFAGSGTFDRVMRAIQACRKHRVEFNTLTLVNKKTADCVDEIFDFFVANSIRYLQFIPCVETDPATGRIADFALTPRQYGDFLCRLFDRWYEYGPRNVSIRDFESILSFCLNGRHTICTYSRTCSGYIVIEHTGDAFPCDFFVTPQLCLGNIRETPIDEIASSAKKSEFDRAKQKLPNKCLLCRYLSVCRGGCQKNRIAFDGHPPRESYFCESYKQFFDHSLARFMQLAAQINVESLPKRPFA